MANIKISDLTSATTPLTGSEEVPMVQSGTTVKALVTDITEKTALQSVIDYNHNLTDGNNYQGTGAGVGNTGVNSNIFGTDAGVNNSGSDVNFFGANAGYNNTGDSVNTFGNGSGDGNTGNNCNFFGASSGVDNTYNSVVLFGQNSTADDDNQMVFTTEAGVNCRWDIGNLTADRNYTFPDTSGTLATVKYVVYTAVISQSGTSAPTVDYVLENTLGFSPTFGYVSQGIYSISSSFAWTNLKTVLLLTPGIMPTGGGVDAGVALGWERTSSSVIQLKSKKTSDNADTDSLISKATIEIRIYL